MKNQFNPPKRRAAFLLLLLLFTCPHSLFTQTIDPPRKWATTLGGANFDFITDAVSDGTGGLYVTGYTNSPNFPTTLPGNPGAGYDAFVTHLDSTGTPLWSTRYGGANDDFANAIARDANGNLIIAGKLGGHGTFITDSTYKGTGEDILVLKLTATGTLIAALRYGGSAADEALGITTDPQNQLVVVGHSASTNIPTTSSTYNGTSGDAFILRLRSDLSRHLAFRYGGNSFEKAHDVAINPLTGDCYITGETGSADYPQTISTYQGSGGAKAFIMRFDSLGARTWAQRYGGSGVERAYAVELPTNGGLVVAGYTTSANFPLTITGHGGAGQDAFLLHLNLDGTRDYARRLGGSLDDQCMDIATDATGNIFMAGETFSTNFPSTNDRFKGQGRDQFIAKFSPAGNYEWSFPFGGSSNDFSGGTLTSTAATVYLAGHTQSTNYPQTLTGTGGNTARGAILRIRDCLGQDADFTFQHVCEFDTVTFTNLSVKGTSDTIACRWWFGDGDSTDAIHPTHYYSTPGAYQVTLRVTSPCGVDSMITQTVHVYPAPRADFAHSIACATRFTDFTDSTTLDTAVTSYKDIWMWELGTGDTAWTPNPAYVYPSAGSYNVLLTVTSNHGCSDTAAQTITVHHRPFADFSVADVCLRDTAWFSDSTTISGDSLDTWAWDFGDGGNSTLQNPGYLYANPDTFTVQLTITSNESCSDTATQSIIVLPLPTVDFGMTAVCWPDTVTYTDSSSITGDLIAAYQWHFGDGQSDILQNTTHAYTNSGNYNVVLWAFTASGCADSLLQSLTVHDKPAADFNFTNVCWPEPTPFSDNSSIQTDSLIVWTWAFGDGGSDLIPDPTHAFAVADTYAVSLEVVSAFGCRDTVTQDVILLPKPEANFSAPDVCEPLPANFTSTSAVNGDLITAWDWDFGDGGTSFLPITLHFYSAPGGYPVTLMVETASGCRDTIQDSVYMFPQPTAAFQTTPVCNGDTMFFTDASTLSNGTIDQYTYLLGDGSTVNAADTHHVYGQAGTYIVTHTVTSDRGCADITIQTVTVHELPDPAPTVVGYPDICLGDTITLQEFQPFIHYAWETGDTVPVTTIAGRSDWVVLTVTDSNLCTNADSVEVRFHAVPRPNAIIVPGPEVTSCSADSLFLSAGGSYASYQWSDGPTTDVRYVSQTGTYTVVVSNGFGCTDTSDLTTVTILPSPSAPVITQNGNQLTATPATAWQWYLNGLPIPNATTQNHTATATGDYSVRITDPNGCTAISNEVSIVVATTPAFLADFILYPNPFSETTRLSGTLKKGGTLEIQLTDVTGQMVMQDARSVSAGTFEYNLDASGLPSGYYLCQLRLGKEVLHRALVKQ